MIRALVILATVAVGAAFAPASTRARSSRLTQNSFRCKQNRFFFP